MGRAVAALAEAPQRVYAMKGVQKQRATESIRVAAADKELEKDRSQVIDAGASEYRMDQVLSSWSVGAEYDLWDVDGRPVFRHVRLWKDLLDLL